MAAAATPRKSARERHTVDFAGVVALEATPLNLLARPSARLLLGLAARRWGVRADLLVSPSRDSLVVAARHHAMWLVRTHTRLTLPQIGRMFGGRDHTTVISALVSHRRRMAGGLPSPYVWTPTRAQAALRMSRAGATLQEIGRAFGLRRTEIWRHPAFAMLKAQSRSAASNRAVMAELARKQVRA